MCGRFDSHSPAEVIKKTFGAFATELEIEPNYNVAPSQTVLVIDSDGKKQLRNCRWGFVPSWSKEISAISSMINARAGTVASKPTFRDSFRKRRCLVIADGFYEWRREGSRKVPVYIRLRSGRPFGLAGLYNPFRSDRGKTICTCTIITTEANELLKDIHDRMPVILPKEKEDFWLDPENMDISGLQAMLRPYPSEEMEYYEVSTKVNVRGYNSPENIVPLRKD